MLRLFSIALSLVCCFVAIGQGWSDEDIERLQQFSLDRLPAVSDPSNKYLHNKKAIAFGKKLFSEKGLSSNGEVACSSCHIQKYQFTDNRQLALGLRKGFRNTSTLVNVGYQQWFFADGSKDSLWAQVLSSIENPSEQNFTRAEMMHFIANSSVYRRMYENTFDNKLPNSSELERLPIKAGPNGNLQSLIAWKKISKDQRHQVNRMFTNIGKAIAAYVATIQVPETRFDDFIHDLKTNRSSKQLTASEQRGFKVFLRQDVACTNCHSGPLFSNKAFHNIATGIPGKDNGRSEVIDGVVRDEFNCFSQYSDAKPSDCTELKYINRDKHQLTGSYKTSTLRGIGKTAPYMHDGRFSTLNNVIHHYEATSQLSADTTDLSPFKLSEQERQDLVNFLLTL